VAVNTAAIPRELIESELFGHEKGAFTGAVARTSASSSRPMAARCSSTRSATCRRGPDPAAARAAIGAHPAGRRARGDRIDVRIIAATNRDLEPMIAAGTFREDLFYRLNVVPIQLPPLRERRGDIEPLARHFLRWRQRRGCRAPPVRRCGRLLPASPGAATCANCATSSSAPPCWRARR
jgi:two-component system, NtrC family, nitrogen regulation response regulator GlnG